MTQTPTGPAADGTGQLDEAYQRLHATGPEFDGWLSNHGPMGAEAIVRHGHAAELGPWLDGYITRLEEFPRGLGPIGDGWRDALGDPRRIADWTGHFRAELAGQPWREVLGTWWPRLLPGVVAAATHGVIRTGHAVRALLADGEDEPHLTELAHGLAYWAARWQTLPAGHQGAAEAAAQSRARFQAQPRDPAAADRTDPTDLTDLSGKLAAVPRLAGLTGGIRDRLARLPELDGWPDALAGLPAPGTPEETRATLTALVDAAALSYLRYGHGNPVMLVHAATAPNAVLRVLPVLDPALWAPSLTAAWAASSALTAIYAPAGAAPEAPRTPGGGRPPGLAGVDEAASMFARAVEHGDAHVVKFADTALDVFGRTGNPDALAAAHQAADLIDP